MARTAFVVAIILGLGCGAAGENEAAIHPAPVSAPSGASSPAEPSEAPERSTARDPAPEWVQDQSGLATEHCMPLHGWGDDSQIAILPSTRQGLQIVWGGETPRDFDVDTTRIVVRLADQAIERPERLGGPGFLTAIADDRDRAVWVHHSYEGFFVGRTDGGRLVESPVDFVPRAPVAAWLGGSPVVANAQGQVLELRKKRARERASLTAAAPPSDVLSCEGTIYALAYDRTAAHWNLTALAEDRSRRTVARGLDPPKAADDMFLTCAGRPVLGAAGRKRLWMRQRPDKPGTWREVTPESLVKELGEESLADVLVATAAAGTGAGLAWVLSLERADEIAVHRIDVSGHSASMGEPWIAVNPKGSLARIRSLRCVAHRGTPFCAALAFWDFGQNMAATPLLLTPGAGAFRWTGG